MANTTTGVPQQVADALLATYSKDCGVQGLKLVGAERLEDQEERERILSPGALQFIADVQAKSLELNPSLASLLVDRMERKASAAAAANANANPLVAQSISAANPGGEASWTAEKPQCHVEGNILVRVRSDPLELEEINASLKSKAHVCEVDLADTATGHLSSTVAAIGNLASIASREEAKTGRLSLALASIDEKDHHFIGGEQPMPAHVVQLALAAFHCQQTAASTSIPFSVSFSKLETKEEAEYCSALLALIEELLNVKDTIGAFLEIENLSAGWQAEEMAQALRARVIGLGVDVRNFLSNVAFVHRFSDSFYESPVSEELRLSSVSGLLRRISCLAKRREIPFYGSECHEQSASECSQRALGSTLKALSACAVSGVTITSVSLVDCAINGPTGGEVVMEETESLYTGLAEAPTYTRDEFEWEIVLATQYLANYILGRGSLQVIDKSRKQLLTVSSVERIRWELWRMVQRSGGITLPDGRIVTVDEHVFEQAVERGLQKMEAEVDCWVPFTIESKISYDMAVRVLSHLVLSPKESAPESLSAAAAKYCLQPFQNDPMTIEVIEKSVEFPWLHKTNVVAGGKVLFSTNDDFAGHDNLVKTDFPMFRPKNFGAQGQVYDGWETRRHNMYPPDYCIIQLPRPATVLGANFDTAHFLGNHAVGASVEGLIITKKNSRRNWEWRTLVPHVHLSGNSRNFAAATSEDVVTIVKVNNYPDGGIARLQLFGEPAEEAPQPQIQEEQQKAEKLAWIASLPGLVGFPDSFVPPPNSQLDIVPPSKGPAHPDAPLPEVIVSPLVDLAGCEGDVIASSSARYSVPSNMLKNGRGFNMGDGWETVRIRPAPELLFSMDGPVTDQFTWTLFKLSQPGTIKTIGVDTLHNKNNAPLAFTVEVCYRPDLNGKNYFNDDVEWKATIAPASLNPHSEHIFQVSSEIPATHALLKIFPCGGISRLRLFGTPE